MLSPLSASLVQPVISLMEKGINGKGVRRAEISFNYEPRFNGVFSRNLPKLKDGAYGANLDEKE